ncbi:MAG: transposase [Thauera sp.]|nr:transposase [Thauera sp.]
MDVVIPCRTRRTHSEAFKQSVNSACSETGVSVAGVALANGLNANQVRRWMRERGVEPPSRRRCEAVTVSVAAAGFVPVALTPAPEPVPMPVIRLDVQRGAARVKIEWPVEAAGACGAWLRDWLA